METTADMHGPRWGARAETRAELFANMSLPAWRAIAHDLTPGMRVLDIGCGSGEFCRVARDRGAHVSGLDAAEAMIAIARRATPDGDFRVGAMETLPWDDESFDVVTGFNAFHMAADFGTALDEAVRVSRHRVVICNWTSPAQLLDISPAVLPLQPPTYRKRPQPAVGQPGVLEELAGKAGLTVERTREFDVPFEAPDRKTLISALLTTGTYQPAIEHSGEEAVGEALADAAEPHLGPDGTYRFENRFRCVEAVRAG